MKEAKPWLVLVVALVGGMIGGALSTHLGEGSAYALHRGAAKGIRADKFILVGPDGRERGVWQVTSGGLADLSMNDQEGKNRAELRVAQDGRASLGFFDEQGVKRVVLGATAKLQGRSGLGIFGPDGKQLVGLTAAPSGEASLTLYEQKSGLARAGLAVAGNGEPALVLFDQKGKDRAELHVHADGKPALALADENGKTIAGVSPQAQ